MRRDETRDVLANAKDIQGRQRFYPPDEHPAGHRWREYLAHLYELRSRGAESDDLREAIIMAERNLSALEQGEIAAKLAWLVRRRA